MLDSNHKYELVKSQSRNESQQPLYKKLGYFAFLFCLMSTSFFAGRYLGENRNIESREISLDTTPQVFQYNKTFGEPPSPTSDHAWEDLFPIHGGFFIHPKLAPERSAFSVYHQLHCLNALRIGFYTSYNHYHKQSETRHEGHGNGDLPDLPHIRHCIDLIRQSLICQPDLTIEKKNEELGGVTGFGTIHQCKDWGQLRLWISKWEEFQE